ADLVRERADVLAAGGWRPGSDAVRQSHGMRWTLDTDEHVAGLLAGCAGEPTPPLRTPVALLAASLGRTVDEVARALFPVVRDLVGRGLLVPTDDAVGTGIGAGIDRS